MTCEQAKMLIDPYLDGELSAALRRDFDTHRAGCPDCQSQLAMARRLGSELAVTNSARALLNVPLPEPLAAQVRAGVYRKRRRVRLLGWLLPGMQPSWGRALASLATILVLALVAVGGIFWLDGGFRPGPAVAAYQPSFVYAQKQGLDCVFTDTTATSDKLAYQWDFGDGYGSSLRNPEHVYPHRGVYTATLSVSGPRGKGSISEAVDVEPGYTDIVRQTPTSPPTVGAPSAVLATVTLTPPAPSIVITALPSPTLPPALADTPAASPTRAAAPSRTPHRAATTPPLQAATVAPSAHSPTAQSPRPAPPTATNTPQPQSSNTPLPQPSNTPLPPTNTPLPPTSIPTQAPSNTPLPPTNTPVPEPSETPRPKPSETEGPKLTCTPHTGDAPLDRGCDSGH